MNIPSIEQLKLGLKVLKEIQAKAWDEGANAKRNLAGDLLEDNPYREPAA
jgi:hypothetical protein